MAKKSWQNSMTDRLLGRDKKSLGQLELPIAREIEPDRNADKGGRSFYFFDLDDNVMFLSTPIYIFHKSTGAELALTSGEYAKIHRSIGQTGQYSDYCLDLDDQTGSFRNFRDRASVGFLRKLMNQRQVFVKDLATALGFPDFQWKGPSWSCFYHATLNQRPMSLITARGHHPETLKEGIRLFVKNRYLPAEPNYLSIYPVSYPETRRELGDAEFTQSVADLKRSAIRASVDRAIELYGDNPFHRFGMSDDDPHNVELIVQEMTALKIQHPEMSFFVIETQGGHFTKWEVFANRTEATLCVKDEDLGAIEQLSLLGGDSSSGKK